MKILSLCMFLTLISGIVGGRVLFCFIICIVSKRSPSLSECGTPYPQKFSNYDKNGDKLISAVELAAAINCPVSKNRLVFKKTDKNGDGFIDGPEFQFSDMNSDQKIERNFDTYDELGEIIRDGTEFFNRHGMKEIEVKIINDGKAAPKKTSSGRADKSEKERLRELDEMFHP